MNRTPRPLPCLLPALLLGTVLLLAGCGGSEPEPTTGPAPAAGTPAAQSPPRYLLATDPGAALSVLEALKRPVGEKVTVVGRLQKKHKTLASFRLTDDRVEDCLRCGMPGGCKTPWDYCCHRDEMLKSSITVELRDAAGRPVEVGSWGLRELDLVVVTGTLAPGEGTRPLLLIEGGWYRRHRPEVPEGARWPD